MTVTANLLDQTAPAIRNRATPDLRARTPSRAGVPPVVVIGMDCVTGLQTARIFADRRIPVIGIATNPRHPCCRTRACRRIIAADTDGEGLIDSLKALGPTLGSAAVLVPCTDLSVLLVSRNRTALSRWYRMALPAEEVVEMLVDKARFAEFATRACLPIPVTHVLRGLADAELAAATIRYPAILKPAVKTSSWSRRATAKGYSVSSPAELLHRYQLCAPWTDRLVVQEWIEGLDTDQYTCNAYFNGDSEPLVTFTTRKLRQWPTFGGEACLSEESRNEVVVDETLRLFRAAGHRGLGYLEMKRQARTGEYLIVEPNIGRPTGRSASAEAAGVELLYTMYSDLLGQPLPPERTQRYRGVKWIHLRRDFQSAFVRWRRGELKAGAWLQSLRGPMVEALFSWRDPVPFCADIIRVFGEVVRRRFAGKGENEAL